MEVSTGVFTASTQIPPPPRWNSWGLLCKCCTPLTHKHNSHSLVMCVRQHILGWRGGSALYPWIYSLSDFISQLFCWCHRAGGYRKFRPVWQGLWPLFPVVSSPPAHSSSGKKEVRSNWQDSYSIQLCPHFRSRVNWAEPAVKISRFMVFCCKDLALNLFMTCFLNVLEP